MEIGEIKKFKMPITRRSMKFVCGDNALMLENQWGTWHLMAKDAKCKTLYCDIPLGDAKILRNVEYGIYAHSKGKMLATVGKIMYVFDFAGRKAATNLLGIRIFGSQAWGENVQHPWRAEYLGLFGLEVPELKFDPIAGELFWKGFSESEQAIISMIREGKDRAKVLRQQLWIWMCPAFPYEKCGNIRFQISCTATENEFVFHHLNKPQLMEDAVTFKGMMPDYIAERWNFIIEE